VAGGGFFRDRRYGGRRHANVAAYRNHPPLASGGWDTLNLSGLEHLPDTLGREPQQPRGLLYGVVTDLPAHARSLPYLGPTRPDLAT
jgi:hypothetical protein